MQWFQIKASQIRVRYLHQQAHVSFPIPEICHSNRSGRSVVVDMADLVRAGTVVDIQLARCGPVPEVQYVSLTKTYSLCGRILVQSSSLSSDSEFGLHQPSAISEEEGSPRSPPSPVATVAGGEREGVFDLCKPDSQISAAGKQN